MTLLLAASVRAGVAIAGDNLVGLDPHGNATRQLRKIHRCGMCWVGTYGSGPLNTPEIIPRLGNQHSNPMDVAVDVINKFVTIPAGKGVHGIAVGFHNRVPLVTRFCVATRGVCQLNLENPFGVWAGGVYQEVLDIPDISLEVGESTTLPSLRVQFAAAVRKVASQHPNLVGPEMDFESLVLPPA